MTVELMAAVPVGDRRRGLVQVRLQQKNIQAVSTARDGR